MKKKQTKKPNRKKKKTDNIDLQINQKASILMNNLMESAVKPNTEITTLQKKNIMNTYNLYQIVKREDILSIIHLINSMNNSQLTVLRGVLKKNKLIEDFSKGKLDIKEVYNLRDMETE